MTETRGVGQQLFNRPDSGQLGEHVEHRFFGRGWRGERFFDFKPPIRINPHQIGKRAAGVDTDSEGRGRHLP